MVSLRVRVNGAERSVAAPANRLLRDFLRDDLGLTGTKGACDDGMCGSCSVLVDGQVVKSCLVLAVEVDGGEVVTVEGMGSPERLHPVQAALAEHFAVQCGYCTPGFVMTIAALLEDDPDRQEDELRHELSGNICRCTGYVRIVRAAVAAGRELSGS